MVIVVGHSTKSLGVTDVRSADFLPRCANDVVLRRLVPSDLPAFQAYRRDPVIGQYQGWTVKSDAEASEFLAAMSTAALLQPGVWCQIGVADRHGMSLIGDIGLFLTSDGREAQIGISLRRESQGRGIATAAVREAINLLFGKTFVDRVVGIADARNLRSIRMLQRVGMHMIESRETLFREEPCVEHIYAISRQGGV